MIPINTHNARFFLSASGFGVFALTFFGSLSSGGEVTHALQNASIAMLLSAFLMKGFLHVVMQSARAARAEQLRNKASEEADLSESGESLNN